MPIRCPICDGTEFTLEVGKRVCVECGGHQLDFLELLEDEDEAWSTNQQRVYINVAELLDNKKSSKDEEQEEEKEINWLTLEAYNHILKKWTDVLVDLGASPKFKDAIFKIWVQYLRKKKSAFIKKDDPNFIPDEKSGFYSKEGTILTKRDAEIMHGLTVKSKEMNAEDAEAMKLKKMKRKLMLQKLNKRKTFTELKTQNLSGQLNKTLETTNLFEDANKTQEMSDEEMDSSNFISKPLMEEEEGKEMEDGVATMSKTDQEISSSVYVSRHQGLFLFGSSERSTAWRVFSPLFLDLPKLLCLVYMAILISGEDILLLDLLRWCREGYLPYLGAVYLLPQDFKLTKLDHYQFNRPVPPSLQMRYYAGTLATFLSIQELPMPHYQTIINKISEALNLPGDLSGLVLSTVKALMFMGHSTTYAPPMESMVAAAFILAFKVNYGLDDMHEILLSEYAEKLNKILKVEKKTYRVFSFMEWQCYVNRLTWWLNDTAISHFNSDEGKFQPPDAKRYSKYFWSRGIWNTPLRHKFHNLSKTSWRSTLVNACHSLYYSSTEKAVQQKDLFSKPHRVPLKEPLYEYVTNSFSNDPSLNRPTTLRIANELYQTVFKNHCFNWLLNSHEVEVEFQKFGKKIKIVTVPLTRPENVYKEAELVETTPMDPIRLLVPDPVESYWIDHDFKNLENMPQSFQWILKLLSELCETSELDIFYQLIKLENKYFSQVRRDVIRILGP